MFGRDRLLEEKFRNLTVIVNLGDPERMIWWCPIPGINYPIKNIIFLTSLLTLVSLRNSICLSGFIYAEQQEKCEISRA